MPASQRGSTFKTATGWGVRWYEPDGRRQQRSGYRSRTEALDYFESAVRPRLIGLPVTARDPLYREHVAAYLEAHTVGREPSTMRVLRERLRYSERAFGELKLSELEHRAAEIAKWTTTLPAGTRYGIVSAFRQTVEAAVRWKLIGDNPVKAAGRNPQPAPPTVVPLTQAEVDLVAVELGPRYGPMIVFAAETGLRPEEWIALERRDIDRRAGVVRIERTCVDGRVKG